MDADEFRRRGKEMIDYVADYLETIRNRQVYPTVEPGYLRPLLPAQAPTVPDKWEDLIKDFERVIMPGLAHWFSPNFHAYFPIGSSYPAICANILAEGLGSQAFTWSSSPACTELEVIMLDWLGKMLNLPSEFLACSGGEGGGVIQSTACEGALMSLLSARTHAIRKQKGEDPALDDGSIINRLVAYTSDQAHSSVERAGMMGVVRIRKLQTDKLGALQGSTLDEAMAEDKKNGLIPFYVCITLGTTASCAFDKLSDIGPVCQKHKVWLHIDAAYAGSAFICPEFRPILNGVEYATSFNFNPHKWMRVTFDCSAMWVKDTQLFTEAFKVDPIYLRDTQQNAAPDYRHWQIGLARGFRSLKLWFVLRLYGQLGLQEYIRNHIGLARMFEEYVKADPRFEIIGEVVLSLVCFRIKASNDVNEKLLSMINEDRRIHIVPGSLHETYFLRFSISSAHTMPDDVTFAWKIIQEVAQKLLNVASNGDVHI